MNTYPYQITPHEPTKKQLWIAAFTSLLCHMQPDAAVAAADEALKLCNARWENPEWVWCWQYKHNYSIGHRFSDVPNGSEKPEPQQKQKAPRKASVKERT